MCCSRPNPQVGTWLVFLFNRHADVHRRQKREDIGLKCCNKDFKKCERETCGQGHDCKSLHGTRRFKKEEVGCAKAEYEEQVPCDHVGGKTQSQGERPEQENLENLDRRDEDVEEGRNTWGNKEFFR